MKSIILTFIQFFCLGWLLLANPVVAKPAVLLVIQIIGVLLGLWAIAVMSQSKLNVFPDPRKGATLVTKGPYKILRHPMYTSLLLFMAPIAVSNPNYLTYVLFFVLLVNMLFKLFHEEQLLVKRFPEYRSHMQTTWRLLPWVF